MRLGCIIFLTMLLMSRVDAQDTALSFMKIPARYYSKIEKKAEKLEARLTKQSQKALQSLEKKEVKIFNELHKIDTVGATQLFQQGKEKYTSLINKLTNDSNVNIGKFSGEYLPNIDSLNVSLAFLSQYKEQFSSVKGMSDKLESSIGNLKILQSKLQSAEQIKAYLSERKDQIKQYLSKLNNLPKGLTSQYKAFSKEIFYYGQQVKDYKELLNNPEKLEKKVLEMLQKIPAFSAFMKQNSQMVGLFVLPAGYGTAQGLAGLQTRTQVQRLIQAQIASGGANAQQLVSQNLQAAQKQINGLKNKLNSLGGGGSGDLDMPDFKPNKMRTKSFFQRLEYGTNLQTASSTPFHPTTTDIGLSVAYKLNDKNSIGIGASYKMGWGNGFQNLHLTTQGAGLRSFVDIKIKESFFATGGFEYNYQPLQFTQQRLMEPESWQKSGLIGITKVVNVKSKLFKKTKVQLLWDFFSYSQNPRPNPIKFRVGYTF